MDAMPAQLVEGIVAGIRAGRLLPYLGPEVATLEAANAALPLTPETLVARLVKRVAVPSRIRRNLGAAAQYIENFRHRKTLRALMLEAFAAPAMPTRLHRLLAGLPVPLIVDLGYEAASRRALEARADWLEVQGVSRAEFRGEVWVGWYGPDGSVRDEAAAAGCTTLLYKPLGSVAPGGNFLVSDSDFVEVMTEIDIQTPIPSEVQTRRQGRGFVFLGCRFGDQQARTYARQIIKRSGGAHYAVIDGALTRNEAKFVAEQGITIVPLALADFVAQFEAALA